jgi:hypothetical protein
MFLKKIHFFKILKLFLFMVCFFPLTIFANQTIPLSLNLNGSYHSLSKNSLLHSLSNQNLNGRLNETSCTGEGNNALCIAVGFSLNNNLSSPLLIKSLDGGNNFDISTITTNTGTLLGVSCIGNSPSAVCVAGGYLGDNKENGKPYLIQSTNAGVNWTAQVIPGLPTYGLFRKISCTGGTDTSPATCIAVGWGNNDKSSKMYPIIAQSIDGGKTWTSKSISNLSPTNQGQLYSVSCTGEDKMAMCVAIGNYSTNFSTTPLIAQTTDGGKSWVKANYLFATNSNSNLDLTFSDINCNGGNTNSICTIAGRIGTTDPFFNPVVYQTTDRGITWIRNSLETFPPNENGNVNAISCAGLGSNSFCSAVGGGSLKPEIQSKKENTSTFFPLIMESFGDKWLLPTLNTTINAWTNFYSSTCVSDSTHFCIASGYGTNNGKQYPVLAVTSNDLMNWEAKTIASLPTQGLLRSSSCTKSGSLCVAIGYSQNPDVPLIVESIDRGNSWVIKYPPFPPPPPPPPPPTDSYVQCDSRLNCVAVAKDAYNGFFLNEEKTWQAGAIIQTGYKGSVTYFHDLACGETVDHCVGVGWTGDQDGPAYALSLRSDDGGHTWLGRIIDPPDISACMVDGVAYVVFETVTCDTTGTVCLAKGWCAFPTNHFEAYV